MIPNPIRKVLSTIRRHRVRALLMGGQACVFHGASEISRDTDFAILADTENLRRLQRALTELQAENIAVPPFELKYLRKGHAVHFRCHHPEALRVRVDLMSKMRGMAPFKTLWHRRVTIKLPGGELCDMLGIWDLVRAKKTQRDKDWPMLRRLVEAHVVANRKNPTREHLRFWLIELRTPVLLVEIAQLCPELVRRFASERPLLSAAVRGNLKELERLLEAEEATEREKDRLYWEPLKRELEQLRHARVGKEGTASEDARPKHHNVIIEAIKRQSILEFSYEGFARIVEPQTYGMSFTGRYVLRALQTGGASGSGQTRIAKLFDVARISKLQRTERRFRKALPAHNPNDSAMVEIFATLRKPAK